MLTAFTSLIDHSHEPGYQGEYFTYKLFGYTKQDNYREWIYVDKDKVSTCLAQLNLPISMFKFKNE